MLFLVGLAVNVYGAPFNTVINFKDRIALEPESYKGAGYTQYGFNDKGEFWDEEGIIIGFFNSVKNYNFDNDFFYRTPDATYNGILPVRLIGSDYVPTSSRTFIDFFNNPVKAFSVDLGDKGEDSDTIFLEVYSMDDGGALRLITIVKDSIDELDSSFHTLEYEGLVPIHCVRFWGESGPNVESKAGLNSVYFDNVSFSYVPIPGSSILLFSGLIGLLGLRSRRRIK